MRAPDETNFPNSLSGFFVANIYSKKSGSEFFVDLKL